MAARKAPGNRRRGVVVDVASIPLNLSAMAPLWHESDVRGGYSMFIKCSWGAEGEEKHLKMLFSYAGDVSVNIDCVSNLKREEYGRLDDLPTVAYLPHFTSPVAREPYYQDNLLDLMVAEGKTGEVLRNVLIRLHEKGKLNEIERMLENQFKFKKERAKILDIPFDEGQDAYTIVNRPLPRPKWTERSRDRDLLLEGSGCLQWLSVFSYAYREEIDVLLLDEPDAHMHGNLQVALFEELLKVCEEQNKQVIIATHSTRMIEKSKDHLDKVHVIGMDLPKNRVQCLKDPEEIDEFLRDIGALKEEIKLIKKPIIFVEGAHDEKVYQKVLDVFFGDYKDRIGIIPGDGYTDVKRRADLAKKEGKKFCCIVDGDAKLSISNKSDYAIVLLDISYLPEELQKQWKEVKKLNEGSDNRFISAPTPITLETFYSKSVCEKFPALKSASNKNKMGKAKGEAADHVAAGKDRESLENLRPVIRRALAKLLEDGDESKIKEHPPR